MSTQTQTQRNDDQVTINDFSRYLLDEDADKLGSEIQHEETDLVQMLYSQAPVHLTINLILSVAVALILWQSAPSYLLMPWLLFIILSCGLALGLTVLFNRTAQPQERIPVWRQLFSFNVSCIGLAWGIAALLFMPHISGSQSLLLLGTILFIAVASIPMLATLLSTYLPALTGMFLPVLIWTYLYAGADANLYYALICVAFAALSLLAKNYAGILHSSFRLATIYSRLADAISNEYQTAGEQNRQLKKRLRDITTQNHNLKQEKKRLYRMFQSMGEGIISCNETGIIEFINPVAEVLTGWSEIEARGRKVEDIFPLSSDDQQQAEKNPVEECLQTGKPCCTQDNTILTRKDGLDYSIECTASPVRDQQGKSQGMILIFRDVTEKRNITREISWQATHDPLTRLINRREFENRLSKLVNSASRDGYTHVLCFLDLDQFKLVNDSYGHAAGDDLLKKLSAALRIHVRGTDTLARLGGDEFGVLLYSCSLDKARLIADGLRQLVEDFRFIWNGKTLRVGVSIGLVEIDNSWKDINQVLSAADSACYSAKDSGRNRIHIYRANDIKTISRKGEMRLIQDLQNALENGTFELHQQEIKALAPGQQHLKQCEILTRMKTESGDLISAADYMPTAERYRLMPQIDRWVVKTTLNAIHYHHPCFCKMQSVSINISSQSLCDDRFLHFILELLNENDVAPEILCFEISESSYLNNQPQAEQFILRLKEKGCRFTLDNFGAVSSAFNFLNTLKVDYLKIDGEFFNNIANDEMERNMVDSINHLGHRMGVKTIAQHIPDENSLSILRDLGVDYAQGYIIDEPQPINNLLTKVQA